MKPLIIEDREFRLEQCEVGSPFWDLYIKKIVHHKDGTESAEWKIYAYGVQFIFAIETIISCRMAARKHISENEKPFLLKEFFDAYKKERIETLKAFNLTSIDLTKDLIKLQKEISTNGDSN